MQLFNPCSTRILNWRVQENDLILYPNLMHDRLHSHMSFKELSDSRVFISAKNGSIVIMMYLFVFTALVASPFVRDIS